MMNRVKHLRTVRQKQNTEVLHDEQSQTCEKDSAHNHHLATYLLWDHILLQS